MSGLVTFIVVAFIVFVVPIVLGVLATGRFKRHRGTVACSACGYELTGLDGKAAKCPECGGTLAGEGTLRAGVERFRANPWWVRYPAVVLLLAPPFGVAMIVYNQFIGPAWAWLPWVVVAGYPAAVWGVCRVPAKKLSTVVRVLTALDPADAPHQSGEPVNFTPPS